MLSLIIKKKKTQNGQKNLKHQVYASCVVFVVLMSVCVCLQACAVDKFVSMIPTVLVISITMYVRQCSTGHGISGIFFQCSLFWT